MTWWGSLPSQSGQGPDASISVSPTGTGATLYERLIATRVFYDGPVNGPVHGLLASIWPDHAITNPGGGGFVDMQFHLYDDDTVNNQPNTLLGTWSTSGGASYPEDYVNGQLFLDQFTWSVGTDLPATGVYYWVVAVVQGSEVSPNILHYASAPTAEYGKYTTEREVLGTSWGTTDTTNDGFYAAFTDAPVAATDLVQTKAISKMTLTSYDAGNHIQTKAVSRMALTTYDANNFIQTKSLAKMILYSVPKGTGTVIFINRRRVVI